MEYNICFSGGAEGSDLLWGDLAESVGHDVMHFMFKGHKGSKHPKAVIVTPDDLRVGDPILKKVNSILGRSFPAHSEFVTNLLRRNYWQVHDSQSVYALAGIGDDGLVMGGTSWAVECFKVLRPNSDRVYVYDILKDGWFQWMPESFDIPLKESKWSWIERPPSPSGKWTGIGTRPEFLTKKAEMAARSLFE